MSVGQLNEYAQRERMELRYEEVGSVGLDHIKTFTMRAVLNGKPYPEGVGKNKKEAKHDAAAKALSVLLEKTIDPTENAAEASPAPADQTVITQANYTCWLNEYCHKRRVDMKAVETTRLGPAGASQCCRFIVGDKEYPTATGRTKKDAKEEAAKLVYQEICGSNTTETTIDSNDSTSAQREEEFNQNVLDISVNFQDNSCAETNYIGIVNNYCQKTNRSLSYVEERRRDTSDRLQFFFKFIIDKKDYPVGEGWTTKKAKQKAAQLAWFALQEQTDWDSKVSVRSTEDGGPPILTALESNESSSATTGDSKIFADSSNSKNQAAVKDQNTGNSQNETSIESRFTSDFDPMECLGSGGYGYVYKAKHKLLEKDFAVKIVCCEENSRALREVGTLSDLLHPNIVRYYASWMEDSGYQGDSESTDSSAGYSSFKPTNNSSAKYLYIQMELCDTKTLKEWIAEKNTESLQDSKRSEEGLNIAQQIVNGVEYIHSKKHIHRDLKPDNILFGLNGEVKIGDFGLVTRDDDDGNALIDRTTDSGTESYMAPEQNKKNYDRKVDIFALGLIFLEIFWKISTCHEKGMILKDARRQNLPKDFLQTFPQEIQIIKLMLREKPEERPDASKVQAGLEKCAKTFNAHNEHQKNATV
ncbi:interferon-induced, double-stranded RNA-activated protein kinase-like isoform X2 [Clinocottus analis]|uniref:interferon-induced, double-stranded RNA-activated protein kinase-like isoform X2 n=1 Tax=Clinocottus analis TaxID=304258 RepID=UPI0035C14C53